MNAVDAARLDRSAFQIGSLNDDREELEYWRAKSPGGTRPSWMELV